MSSPSHCPPNATQIAACGPGFPAEFITALVPVDSLGGDDGEGTVAADRATAGKGAGVRTTAGKGAGGRATAGKGAGKRKRGEGGGVQGAAPNFERRCPTVDRLIPVEALDRVTMGASVAADCLQLCRLYCLRPSPPWGWG